MAFLAILWKLQNSRTLHEGEICQGQLAAVGHRHGIHFGFGHEVIRAYRKRIQMIESAEDERDFYCLKSLHYEKLSGARSHQHSMRLNDQWRLIIELEAGTPKNTIVVTSIEDYH